MVSEWDAATYDRIADPQARWGAAVLHRLPLRGDERVLDAGCGSGRVTELLVQRLPQGHVVALDGSTAMLAEASRRLAPWADQVSFIHADLSQPLPIDEPVDAILSTATFHWVTDHDTLFAHLAAALRPGGALVAQCGGHGNVASILGIAEELGAPGGPRHFATAGDTARRLETSGFADVWTWLYPEPTPFDPADLRAFLETVVLRSHLEGMGEAEKADFIDAVVCRMEGPTIDYVRLNILARRRVDPS
jgi:trans-aconitate 2-methyltransferase